MLIHSLRHSTINTLTMHKTHSGHQQWQNLSCSMLHHDVCKCGCSAFTHRHIHAPSVMPSSFIARVTLVCPLGGLNNKRELQRHPTAPLETCRQAAAATATAPPAALACTDHLSYECTNHRHGSTTLSVMANR